MVIYVQKIVECKLVIESEIEGKKDNFEVNGRGYYKDEDRVITVYFSNGENKYKFIYSDNKLVISFNESSYSFIEGSEDVGIIKSGNLALEIATYAYKLNILENLFYVEYSFIQQGNIIGKYKCELSFY